MSTLQLEKALVESTKGLSVDILQEILDFILFVRQKKLNKSVGNLTNELSRLNTIQTVHLEQEFYGYKQIYPNE